VPHRSRRATAGPVAVGRDDGEAPCSLAACTAPDLDPRRAKTSIDSPNQHRLLQLSQIR
jgi:hypothetical protein